jgi:FkbM family methyltransferase
VSQPLLSRVSGVISRFANEPSKECRRLKLKYGLSVFEPQPEGVGLYLYPGEQVSQRIFGRNFETAVRQAFVDLLRPGWTVVDAGANLGLYTVIAAKLVGPSGRVFAFEPSERECRRARKTIRANRFNNVELYLTALGEADGEVSLTVCEESCGGYNSIGKLTHPVALGHASHVERVRCRALDSFMAEKKVRQVHAVKMDVEGAEELVLRGGRQLFSSQEGPLIFCEVSDKTALGLNSSAERVLALLGEYGYEMFTVAPESDGYTLRPQVARGRIEYEEVLALKPWQASELTRIAGNGSERSRMGHGRGEG